MRVVVLIAALAACAKPSGVIRSGSGVHSSAPGSYGSSTETQVYRTTATGAPISGPTGVAVKDTGGKAGGGNELLRSGLMTLAISYVTTVVIGQVIQATLIGDFETAVGAKETIARLWIPVVGPWAALIYNETTVRPNCEAMAGVPPWEYYDCSLMTQSSLAVAAGAVAQTAGLVMTLIALQRPPKPVKHDERRVTITPHGNAGGGAGFVISGQF